MTNQPEWPKSGDKVIFVGCPKFYYPMAVNMRTFCDQNLIVGNEYIIHDAKVWSSWCSVEIKGFEGTFLNWRFFEYAI